MPLYDFHCPACDQTSEMLVRADALPPCPGCGGTMVRLVSGTAPPGKSKGIISSARAQARREGHFSNFD